MDRRTYLGVIGGLTAIAGCSGGSGNNTNESRSGDQNTTTSGPSFELVESDIPETINADEESTFLIHVENVGDESGSCTGNVEGQKSENSWQTVGGFTKRIEPGSTSEINPTVDAPAETGTWEFRFTPFEKTWMVDVSAENATPEIIKINLISEWDQYGDVNENQIESVAVGEYGRIGARYTVFVHDGTFHVTTQVEIYEESTGDRVFIDSYESDQIVDRAGYSEWENAIPFDTSGWDTGEYSAEFTVRDEISREVSDTKSVSFEVVEP